MKREKVKEILKNGKPGDKSLVKGWVRTKRASKNVTFININDGSAISSIQVVADTDKFGEQLLKTVNTGTALAVEGTLTESQGSGQSLELNA
ncbi:MAG: asparagine--tRNA ligase, partial [Bacteroidales bacterium]|nr:asparagine--tRNA ligase [Bacteroidales bacterium]